MAINVKKSCRTLIGPRYNVACSYTSKHKEELASHGQMNFVTLIVFFYMESSLLSNDNAR
jgi:hypothetical protein